MSWIIIALIAPLIWSFLNHIDKYIISKYSQHVGVGGIIVVTSVFSGLTLPFIFILNHNVLNMGLYDMFALTLTGIITSTGILFYLYALDRDDASHVIPFWFLIPIFSYGLGILFLGEYISLSKIIGSLIALCGAFILSLEFENGFKVKRITSILMLLSSLFLALSNVLFKDSASHHSFWQSIFWNQFGILSFGLLLLIFVKKYRHYFIKLVEVKDTKLIILNFISEILQIIASIIAYYSILIAPVSLVLLVGYTFQPLFVFVEGILITLIFPNFITEKINKKHILQKLLAIIVMALGVYQLMI